MNTTGRTAEEGEGGSGVVAEHHGGESGVHAALLTAIPFAVSTFPQYWLLIS